MRGQPQRGDRDGGQRRAEDDEHLAAGAVDQHADEGLQDARHLLRREHQADDRQRHRQLRLYLRQQRPQKPAIQIVRRMRPGQRVDALTVVGFAGGPHPLAPSPNPGRGGGGLLLVRRAHEEGIRTR